MKYSITFLLCVVLSMVNFAQKYSPISNSATVKKAIQLKHQNTKTLSADFNEEVHSSMFNTPQKGTGTLLFKQSDKIRWENTSSKQLILINGDNVKLYDNGKASGNPMANKLVKKIQGMMLSMLSGDFLNEKEFNIAYFENGKNYKLILTPKNARMSKYISKIELYFNQTSLLLTEMILHESKDQKMIYTFTNTKTNQPINDSKFNQR